MGRWQKQKKKRKKKKRKKQKKRDAPGGVGDFVAAPMAGAAPPGHSGARGARAWSLSTTVTLGSARQGKGAATHAPPDDTTTTTEQMKWTESARTPTLARSLAG